MITITRSIQGYTAINYNGVRIAKHYLSATTDATREAFDIPEETSIDEWFETNYAEEIADINNNL